IARLLEIDLIEELERLDLPGHPASYGVSERFLKCFGLNLSSDLPKLEMISYASIQEIEQNLPEELLNR
ncbi:MAG: SMC-Scp complex subunit ScpB, partial [Eubacteriales bacterium]|nr:SMC-Scp complex subunit ScpB [Eubacteriales bacterium]